MDRRDLAEIRQRSSRSSGSRRRRQRRQSWTGGTTGSTRAEARARARVKVEVEMKVWVSSFRQRLTSPRWDFQDVNVHSGLGICSMPLQALGEQDDGDAAHTADRRPGMLGKGRLANRCSYCACGQQLSRLGSAMMVVVGADAYRQEACRGRAVTNSGRRTSNLSLETSRIWSAVQRWLGFTTALPCSAVLVAARVAAGGGRSLS
mmetsp:Transcript_77888/g.161814  ORF Transcript_77888/g.161814 Transcript_77888/m.161814 type:complete len:205 (-) Transcript_77888:402-1016(-)